jgi:hypothetical protein
MMKRRVTIMLCGLQTALLASASALPWLEKRFMSVTRYLANKNRLWGQSGLSGWLPTAVEALMAGALVLVLARLTAAKTNGTQRPLLLLVTFSLTSVLFIFIFDSKIIRSYNFILIIIALLAIIQIIKVYIN